jgi:membrane-associated phospholipid phosphatase
MKFYLILLTFLIGHNCTTAQVHEEEHDHDHNHIYNWNWKKDGYILGGSFLGWGTSRFLKEQADKITLEDLPQRDPDYLWGIDRGATLNRSDDAKRLSDIFLYTSFLLPISHYTGLKCRKQGFVIAGMALETFFITDGITNTLKALTKRFRPFTYNPEVPIEEKLVNSARYSFVSGHSSNTAALGFFSAKVFSDLYPDSKWKPVIWTLGATLPAMTGYLRYRAGKHFPTDIISGYILGASVGYLIPHFHKISNEDLALNLIPLNGGMMFSFSMTLK